MTEVLSVSELASLIRLRATARGRGLLVALDGYSGCGKSTLAAQLAALTDVATVHCDDFYRDLPDDVRRSLTPGEGVERYFDWQRLRDEALVPLRAERVARFQPYDWAAGGGLGAEVEVPAVGVILVEGVYSARPQFAEYIDIAVYVDAPEPVRRARLAERGHGNDEWNSRWDAAERVYFGHIRPLESFPYLVAA